jgi:murein DD-endopeptidase MepM/ murein hydrolase activator NlpD
MRLSVAALGLAALLAAAPAAADDDIRLDGPLTQGGLVAGWTRPGATVRLDGRALRVDGDGGFVFGFGRDAAPSALLEIALPDGRRLARPLGVAQRRYDIQRIDGLPPAQVTPPPEVMARIRREAELIAATRRTDSAETRFRSGWVWPVEGRITGVYGSQRILNGEPRQPHYGIDIAAPEGTAVVATTDGVVLLAEGDLYFTGGTVIVDHGFGVTATYSHLKEVAVRPGERVAQRARIGSVGATGRVTGAHLDWRVNWFDVRLDPLLLLPPANGQ